MYTLFQNGRQFIILLFDCSLRSKRFRVAQKRIEKRAFRCFLTEQKMGREWPFCKETKEY